MTEFEQAQYYVGNPGEDYTKVGLLQLELLKMNGCEPGNHVLEIGCGCLVAGRPILEYLDPDRYVGIEPNEWLIEAVMNGLPETRELVRGKRPIFLTNSDFDASAAGRTFDFVISHSILSHAAHWQCSQFFGAVRRVLAASGVAIVSIRFMDEANRVVGDSMSPEWVYPGVSYFAWETVQAVASQHDLNVEWRKDYRDFFVRTAPSNYHDWIRITHKQA